MAFKTLIFALVLSFGIHSNNTEKPIVKNCSLFSSANCYCNIDNKDSDTPMFTSTDTVFSAAFPEDLNMPKIAMINQTNNHIDICVNLEGLWTKHEFPHMEAAKDSPIEISKDGNTVAFNDANSNITVYEIVGSQHIVPKQKIDGLKFNNAESISLTADGTKIALSKGSVDGHNLSAEAYQYDSGSYSWTSMTLPPLATPPVDCSTIDHVYTKWNSDGDHLLVTQFSSKKTKVAVTDTLCEISELFKWNGTTFGIEMQFPEGHGLKAANTPPKPGQSILSINNVENGRIRSIITSPPYKFEDGPGVGRYRYRSERYVHNEQEKSKFEYYDAYQSPWSYSNAMTDNGDYAIFGRETNNGDLGTVIWSFNKTSIDPITKRLDVNPSSLTGTKGQNKVKIPGEGATIVAIEVTKANAYAVINGINAGIYDLTKQCVVRPVPTANPSNSPSAEPSNSPSAEPSNSPSAEPSNSPNAEPSNSPSGEPSNSPTQSPVPTSPLPASTFLPTASPLSSESSSKIWSSIYFWIILAAVILAIIIIVCCCIYLCKRKKKETEEQNLNDIEQDISDEYDGSNANSDIETGNGETMSLLNAERDKMREFNFNEAADEYDDLLELQFKTESENIGEYHDKLLKKIMKIHGLKEKIHSKEIRAISDNEGRMKFILRQDPETAMEDEAIMALLALLRNDDRVKKVKFQKAKSPNVKPMRSFNDEDDADQDLLELQFKTKSANIGEYHRELLKKIMKIRGLKEKIHSKEIREISDNEGKMKFILMQDPETAMEDEAIMALLALLRNDDRVKKVKLQKKKSDAKPMRSFNDEEDEFEYLLELEFKLRSENIEQYHAELLKKIMKIPGLKAKIHSNEFIAISDKKGRMKFTLRQNPETVMEDEAIMALLALLKNEDRIKKIDLKQNESNSKMTRATKKMREFHFKEEESEDEYEELLELKFKTKSPNIGEYHEEMMEKIMKIPGFKEKIHAKEIRVLSNTDGRMKFILKQNPDTAMEDEAIIALLDILRNDAHISKTKMKEEKAAEEAKKPMREFRDEEDEYLDLLELAFKTKSEVIQVYHEILLKRILNIPGFYDKLHDYKTEIISDKTGKMTFIIKQNADNAMEDPIIQKVLALLKDDFDIFDINMDENDTIKVSNSQKNSPRVAPRPKLTQAMCLSFVAKDENVKEFAESIMSRLMKIENFKYKMYEHVVTIMREDKAKLQLIMYHSGVDAMNDPSLVEALDILKVDKQIRKLKVQKIPYFLES